ncbi:hypothetical protein ILYODFUR_022699 [Ilyodon furcidens]|uniref:Uncharacterized protein n=1 Tax=Ilyodon furcidens TaxID=33524 RepID=A0ABV0VHB6_9TELE
MEGKSQHPAPKLLRPDCSSAHIQAVLEFKRKMKTVSKKLIWRAWTFPVVPGVDCRGQYGSLNHNSASSSHSHAPPPPNSPDPSSIHGPPGTAGSPTVPSARPGLI